MSEQAEVIAPSKGAAIQNYRVQQFAEVFGVSVRTARRLISSGEVEAIRIGRRVVITAESATAWRDRCPRVASARA